MIYLDSSAVVKLTHDEEHSSVLRGWLAERDDRERASSVLLEVEVVRALRRDDPDALPMVPQVLDRIDLIDLVREIRSMAGTYPARTLRSLDAIHLATARYLASATGTLPTFVAYDARLLEAARDDGFHVAAPGVEPA